MDKVKKVAMRRLDMDLKNKYVLVAGCGISGTNAAQLLYNTGAIPILYDGNEQLKKEDIEKKIPENSKIEILIGNLSQEIIDSLSLVVLSPGIPADTEFADGFRKKNIPVWGEVELAYQFAKGELVAITGTNGKTTTTALTGQIMKDYYESVFIVGNIGNAYTKEALNTNEKSVTVAEISSFQLETIECFKPHVSAILNITPDHLNRHHTMDNYVAIKQAITSNQTADDFCVLNHEDEYLKAFVSKCTAKIIWFSSKQELKDGYYLSGDIICKAVNGKKEELLNIHDMKLLGLHNVENVMAAIAMSEAFGVPMNSILTTVKEFRAVEHRIEYVATKKGVDYYNDSKGTNPDAAIQGIKAMNRQTVLIGGGYDKQSTYDEWIESFGGKVKCLVLIGQTRDKIAECAKKHNFTNIMMADSLEEAMDICERETVPGEAVLLSPACASWGMFPNYEVRGKMFKELVMKIKE